MVTKRQHFVPASYLQFFGVSESGSGRQSKVYVLSSNRYCVERVENVSFSNWTYSKQNPNEAEKYFHQIESTYPNLLRRLLKLESVSEIEKALLFITAVNLNLRNPSYIKPSPRERIDLIKISELSFIFEKHKSPTSFLTHLMIDWTVRILKVDEFLVTSDNPSVMFSTKDEFSCLLLPLTPSHLFVAYRKSIFRDFNFKEIKISERDISNLNAYQAIFSIREIYSNLPHTPEEIHSFRKWFKRKIVVRGEITSDFIKLSSYNYPPLNGLDLSFLRTL
jgi:hypothetical protein